MSYPYIVMYYPYTVMSYPYTVMFYPYIVLLYLRFIVETNFGILLNGRYCIIKIGFIPYF